MLGLLLVIGVLLLRAVYLEVFQQEDLQKKADIRQLRDVVVPAYRGMILDRNGEPMAISTPVESIKCEPKKLLAAYEKLRHDNEVARQGTGAAVTKPAEGQQDAAAGKSAAEQQQARDTAAGAFTRMEGALHTVEQQTGLAEGELLPRLEKDKDKSSVYLARYLPLENASAVLDLELPGVSSERDYRRYYPQVDAAGHVVGMTDSDGKGIEGVEKVRNDMLAGKPGKIRGIIDGQKRLVEQVDQLSEMQPGQDVQLSIDQRIQYLAYKELLTRVYELNAKAGSLVVLDAHTGEILAMVNVPSFNPNNRKGVVDWHQLRNRAATDKAEPGSTLKPLTIAAALESRVIGPDVEINTSPGRINFGKYVVKDHRDYGSISLPTLLAKSSNVGASRVALLMNPRDHWMFLKRLGFGRVPDAGVSGETAGELRDYASWGQVDRAAHGYGYGLSVSLLQMAHAYAPFAAGGLLMPVSIYKVDQPVTGQRVMSEKTARDVVRMMEAVVHKGGTGEAAMVEGYRVAGKTGTAYKHLGKGKGYSTDRYMTSFIGVAPASRPRLVVAVQIDEPKVDDSGGKAAAPVFSKVMGEALRLLDIPPDNLPGLKQATQPQAPATPVQGAT